jgi:PadR family transcriptional regulator AphA
LETAVSLDHILLGMLREPASGYDLKQEFERSVRHFWFAELSQIYPALKKLEERGLLSSERVPSSRGPDRRVFETTGEGSEELETWLRSDPIIPTDRVTYLAQLFFMGELKDLSATERFMERLRGAMATRLTVLTAIESEWMGAIGVADEALVADGGALDEIEDDRVFHMYTTLRMGIHSLRSRVEWCDETLDAIRARRARESGAAEEEGGKQSADEGTGGAGRMAATEVANR